MRQAVDVREEKSLVSTLPTSKTDTDMIALENCRSA